MSTQTPQVRAELYPGGPTIEGVEIDRTFDPRYNDRDREAVHIETECGTRYAVWTEQVLSA